MSDPNNFDNMSLPEDDNEWDDHPSHDGDGHDDHGGHDDGDDHNAQQPAAPAKRSLNMKKIGLLLGGAALIGAGVTFGPDLYQTYLGAPEQVNPAPAHHIKPATRQIAQNATPETIAPPVTQEQPTSPPLALPDAPKPPIPAATLSDSKPTIPAAALPDSKPAGLDKPLGLALPDGTSAPPDGTSALTAPVKSDPAPIAATPLTPPAPVALSAPQPPPEAPDSSSLTDVLNALHDNGKTVSDSVDHAASQISEHIDSKSDEVMSRLQQMQSTISELTAKTETLSKNIENVETHGLQKPSSGSSEAKKTVAQHVTKPHKIHHYRITSSPAAVAEPTNANLSEYHLRGFAKNMVLIQGPSGLMSVPIGSPAILNGKPVPAIGTVQGLIRDGDKYVAKTTTGSIVQE